MFIKRIKDLREDNDLTQNDVAIFLNCNREVYRRYETGERTIPLEFIISLSRLYNVSIDYLVGLTEYKQRLTKEYIDKLIRDYEKSKQ